MKKALILISLYANLSVGFLLGQNAFYKIKPVQEYIGSAFITKTGDCGLSFSQDTSTFDTYLLFWNKLNNIWESQIIDTVGIPPYGCKLHIYKSHKTSEFLIICESETEFYSFYNIYYLNNNLIAKVGPFPIQDNCRDCDDSSYPIEKICIKNFNNEIQIRLLKPYLFNIGENNWQLFSNKNTYFTIDKRSKKLINH